MGFDSRANYALGLPRSRTSTGSSLCTVSPSNPPLRVTDFSKNLLLGGDDGIRTHDPLLAGQVLSQLSYTPRLNLRILLFSPFSQSSEWISPLRDCVSTELSSRTVSRKVFSPLQSLTSVFGMGTGGPSAFVALTSPQ